jgi:hypothetical protein
MKPNQPTSFKPIRLSNAISHEKILLARQARTKNIFTLTSNDIFTLLCGQDVMDLNEQCDAQNDRSLT